MKKYVPLLMLIFGLSLSSRAQPVTAPAAVNTDAKSATDSAVYTQQILQICTGDTFFMGGKAYTHTGLYIDTIVTGGGYDSIITLRLFVRAGLLSTDNAGICTGDTFWIGNRPYFTAGHYLDTLTAEQGCDSVIILNLIVNPPPVVTLSWDSMIADGRFTNVGQVVYCNNINPDTVTLEGGAPLGGTYTGVGVGFDYNHYFITLFTNYSGLDTITYTVDTDGCPGYATKVVGVEICEGLTTIPSSKVFTLYPNPANEYVMIDFDPAYSVAGSTISVKDITGRQLFETRLTTSPQQIPTGNLPPGVYLVTMYSNGGVGARLLVKE